MKFFFDNNLSPRLAQAVSILVDSSYTIQHLRDRFPPDIKDEEWIHALGQEGKWVVISGDLRIYRNRHQREAWRRTGLTAFFLASGWIKLSLLDQSWRFLRWWPMIEEQTKLVQPGAVFEVPVKVRQGGLRALRS